MARLAQFRTGCLLALLLLARMAPARAQGVLNTTVAGIPSTATRLVAIADGPPASNPVYAIQAITPPAASTLLSMSLPGGNYRVRILADGANRTLLASAQMSVQVASGNTTTAFIALAAVSVSVDSSTPATAKAGSPVTIVFNITDWGDVMESANAALYTSTAAFSVATGGVLTASVTPARTVPGTYKATFSVAPAIGSTLLDYSMRASVPVGSPDCPYLYSPDPATRPNSPWQMTITAQSGANITVTGIPAAASRLVVIADVSQGAPFYAQRSITPGTASAAAFIALPAGLFRIRILADSPSAGMLASGQTNVTVTTGVTASGSVALTAMSMTLDPSTPLTAPAASSAAILVKVVDAGNILSGSYAYLWAGLAPFGAVSGGTIAGVAGFTSAGSNTVQAGYSILLPAGPATFYYVLRAQVYTGLDYAFLAPATAWQIQTVVTTSTNLTVTNIPAGAVRLVVLADGPLPTVVSAEQAVSGPSAIIQIAVPAGTYRFRALVDAAAGNIIATGQVNAAVPSTGTGTASLALSAPVVTLSASTPASAQAGSVVMLGFNIADSGDVIENANAYLYTGSASFDLVTGGFLLGVYPVTKSSTGHYTVAFSDTVPSTAGTLYFQVRVQVSTGLVPSYLDSPDPSGSSQPWSMAVSLPGTQSCTPVAVFRDANGSMRMITYGSATVQFLGGQMASDPVVAQGRDCSVYVAARDYYNFVYLAAVDPLKQTTTWRWAGSRTIQGQPSLAVARDGKVYIAARDPGGSYWLVAYTPGVGFGSWGFLGGVLGSDPSLAASPDGSLYIVGRDMYCYVYSAWYVPGSGFQGWKFLPSSMQGKPAVTVGTDAYAYIAIRDTWNYMYIGRLQGNNWLGWRYGSGQLATDPQIAATGDGTVYVAMVDQWQGVWYRGLREGANGAWLSWTYPHFALLSDTPAAVPGDLYIAGRDYANALWWYRVSTNQWSEAGGKGLAAGPLAAAPQ